MNSNIMPMCTTIFITAKTQRRLLWALPANPEPLRCSKSKTCLIANGEACFFRSYTSRIEQLTPLYCWA